VVVDPGDYAAVLEALRGGKGVIAEELRLRLAAKAFAHTGDYDAAVAAWMARQVEASADHGRGQAPPVHPETDDEGVLPRELELSLVREIHPRYGENPHQRAAVYRRADGPGLLGGMTQHQGKQLSWNNVLDADAARRLVSLFEQPAVVIVKHNNPCGTGTDTTLVEAYERAHAGDPVSAFGSIVAVNRTTDAAFVEAMSRLFVEVLVAPAYDEAARAKLAAKENLRVLECPLHRHVDGTV
jgi:phosphoribosylaminoimidazolecarboxamide formyltransferase/IMP cyclohydrolase